MAHKAISIQRRERLEVLAEAAKVLLRMLLKIVVYSILVAWAGIALLPLYWMLSTSIKAATTMLIMPPQWIPRPISFEHYKAIFELTAFPR